MEKTFNKKQRPQLSKVGHHFWQLVIYNPYIHLYYIACFKILICLLFCFNQKCMKNVI